MTRRSTSLESLARTITRALVSTGRSYQQRTGGWASWWAPEALFRDGSARALHRRAGVHVVPEVTLKELKEFGKGELRGRSPRDSSSGRIDLVVLNAKGEPRVLIEVKRGLAAKTLTADRDRLRQITRRRIARWALIAVHGVTPMGTTNAEVRVKTLGQEAQLRLLDWKAYRSGWTCPGSSDSEERVVVAAVFRAD